MGATEENQCPTVGADPDRPDPADVTWHRSRRETRQMSRRNLCHDLAEQVGSGCPAGAEDERDVMGF